MEVPVEEIEQEAMQTSSQDPKEPTDPPESEKLWAQGCADSVESMLHELKNGEALSEPIVDSGAGAGRHVRAALEAGATNIYAVEFRPEAANFIREQVQNLHASDKVTIVEGDAVEELRAHPDNSVAAIIDIGMTHCLTAPQKRGYWQLVHSKLRAGGLYAILHWSDNEVLGIDPEGNAEGGLSLKTLRGMFPPAQWEEVRSWREDSWPAQQDEIPEGEKETHHHACQALLRKK